MAPRKPREPGPETLGARGKALWEDLKTGQIDRDVLVLEACRTTDRLDRLERALAGEGSEWITFREKRDGDVIVVIDSVLTEARQQALALRALLADLKTAAPAAKPEEGGDVVDQLKKRREQRHGGSA